MTEVTARAPVDWLAQLPGIRRDEPLARHSQFGIGGPADWWLRADPAALPEVLRRCHEEQVPVTVLGAGSNTLIADAGIRGLVLELADRRVRPVDDGIVELGGGGMMPRAALDLARLGLAGLEFGVGIPGTCGASVRGNAGAFGREVSDVLVDCDVVLPDGGTRTLDATACEFAYRRSIIAEGALRGAIVTAARFRVTADDPTAVRARSDDITRRRKDGQPWGKRSLGSVFRNPPGDHAGRLVEACGLKGTRVGGAEIAQKHANFILNVDNATAVDVLALVRLAHDTVLDRHGVDLVPEIVLAGNFA